MENIKFYQCCSCGEYWDTTEAGAIGYKHVYCPKCAEKCRELEISLWNQFIKEHGTPTTKDVNHIRWTAWQYLGCR